MNKFEKVKAFFNDYRVQDTLSVLEYVAPVILLGINIYMAARSKQK